MSKRRKRFPRAPHPNDRRHRRLVAYRRYIERLDSELRSRGDPGMYAFRVEPMPEPVSGDPMDYPDEPGEPEADVTDVIAGYAGLISPLKYVRENMARGYGIGGSWRPSREA